jgi:methyl-accepting chemotaxis protein
MNFEEAVNAHVLWKSKLRAYLVKRDGSLKPDEILLDTHCALGKWIYSEAKKYSNLPEYAALKDVHAQFHKYTAQIVAMVDSGDVKKTEEMLGAGSEFMKLSGTCVRMIQQLKLKVEAAK